MNTIIYIALTLVMGVAMSVYLPMNSSVAKYIGSTITANIIFFIIALCTSLLIFVFIGKYESILSIGKIPFFIYFAGFISAFMILGTTILIPHLGARTFFILLITGQIAMAIIISHFGLLESPLDPINFKKVIGATLVIAGAIIST